MASNDYFYNNDRFDPQVHDYIPILDRTTRQDVVTRLNRVISLESSARDQRSGKTQENLELVIIAKTFMNQGKCYIGWQNGAARLWRPIMTTEVGLCCWSTTPNELEVGNAYRFQVIDSNPELIPYPHRWNDVWVSKNITLLGNTPKGLYDTLVGNAFLTVDTAFYPGKIQQGKFIAENTICPSAGIFKCKGHKLRIYTATNQSGKMRKRMKIDDGCEIIYDFPITALHFDESFANEDNVIIVLGLARPFDGNGRFVPKRCYILVVGIIVE